MNCSHKMPAEDILDLHRRHMSGETVDSIRRDLGVTAKVVKRLFESQGLKTRTAHAAVRGSVRSDEVLAASAKAREITFRRSRLSAQERAALAALSDVGRVTLQKACGPYNIDLCVDDAVAVEVFGGNWHGTGRHAARHQKRTRHILEAGYDLVVIWINARQRRTWVETLQQLVTDLKRADRNPTTRRQYRVVWSDGQVVHSGDANDNDFPFEPTFKVRRDARGRYYRVT